MPRLLMFAHYFPPSRSVGALRTGAMAKHLSRLGWKVTVVTERPPLVGDEEHIERASADCQHQGIQVLNTESVRVFSVDRSWRESTWGNRLRSLPSRIFERILWLFGLSHDELWLPSALIAGLRFPERSFDVVLVSGSPFIPFFAALLVARKQRVPVVLDYRDPWSLNFLRGRGTMFYRWLDKQAVSRADSSIFVSPSHAKAYGESFVMKSPPYVLPNGFDPDELEGPVDQISDEFTIVYAGSFYRGQREIDPVLRALSRLREKLGPNDRQTRLHYFGGEGAYMAAKAAHYGVEDMLVYHGRRPRQEVLSVIRSSDVTVVIAGIGKEANLIERGIVTGKLFEPLGLGTPILLIAPECSDARTFIAGTAESASFNGTEVDPIAEFLFGKVRAAKRRAPIKADARYSWPTLGRSLDQHLRGVINAGTARLE